MPLKIHLFSIIRYLLGFILILIFITVFKQNYLVFLLFPYVLLPIVAIPLFLVNCERLSFRGYVTTTSVESGCDVPFFLEYVNPTIIPFPACAFTFTLKNLYYENPSEHSGNFPILPKRTSAIEIPAHTGKVGMVSLTGTRIAVTDFLGFITRNLNQSVKCEVPVLPILNSSISVPATPSSEGFDEYSEPDFKGNPSTEVKEIREYRPGDRLQNIHWKLSAKLDDLFVKELDRTSVIALVVLPELVKEKLEDTIITLNAVANEILHREERFEIAVFNEPACEFGYFSIDSEDSLLECFINLFYTPLYETEGEAIEAYYSSSQHSPFVVHVCGKDAKLLEDGIEYTGGHIVG